MDQELEKIALTRLVHLNEVIYGIVAGAGLGGVVFLATIWLVIKGGSVIGPHLSLLNQFFIGYDVTPIGGIIGFAYGFVLGFVAGFSIARIYNWLVDVRQRLLAARKSTRKQP